MPADQVRHREAISRVAARTRARRPLINFMAGRTVGTNPDRLNDRGLRDRALQQEAIPGVHQMDAHIFFTEAPRLKPSRVVFFDKNVGVLRP